MGINDDAVQDLDDTLVDHDVIRSTPVAPLNPIQTTIVPWSREISPKPQALTEGDIQQIAQSDVQFTVIENDIAHTVELEDVEKEFLAQESICQDTAKYLNEYFEGFLTSRVSIEEFTRKPSRTNLGVTEKFIRQSIVQEQSTIITSFTQFTQSSIGDILSVIQKLDDDYLNAFDANMTSIASLSTDVIAGLSENKNTIVPFQNGEQIEFIDIAEADLICLDFNNLKLEPVTVQQLSLYRDNIKQIVNECDMRILITLAVECGKVSYPVDNAILARSMERPIHLLLIAKLFNSSALRTYIEGFKGSLYECRNLLETLQQDASVITEYPTLASFITERSQVIHSAIKQVLRIALCMHQLNILAWNTKELFSYMNQITHPKA